ncbi:hypothetical protein [Corynebacterium pseudopelargi]|uniref:Uncharacterized protein n=1 Tax=Corynebacterium pseudopelargi TaxID=2080757 RepID=A0A3G6ISP6_9CORY|nr:hypothetical protein [Corynebacterium pseudopelargi]AZA08566.1 hypothetical protein CPPEL_02105 [Corynebacterium pseudopelargi]
MALTFEQAVEIARKTAGRFELDVEYIAHGEGRYQFFKKGVSNPGQLADSYVIVVFEDGSVISGSSAPRYMPTVYEILDSDGNVVKTREEIRQLRQASEAEQAALDAIDDGETGEPVPVEHPYI